MKKIIAIALALLMVFGFAACGEGELPVYSTGLNKDGKFELRALDYVTLPEYIGVDFGDDRFWRVDEELIENTIDQLLSQKTVRSEITDRAIENGDLVNINYAGKIDGVLFDGGSAENQDVTAGSKEFIDDFLDQIIGHLPGERFDIEVTFPDPYENNPELAAKDAVFTITVNYIVGMTVPELTDAFVKENYAHLKLSTVDGLYDYLTEYYLFSQQGGIIDSYLFENSELSELPQIVKDHQIAGIKQNYIDAAGSYGVEVETLLGYYGVESLDEMIEMSTQDIEDMAKDALIYQALAEAIGIKVSNKDVADYFEKTVGSRDYAAHKNSHGLPYLKMMVLRYKVNRYIIDNALRPVG